jgi:MFS family permease
MVRIGLFLITGLLTTLHVSLAIYILSSFIEHYVGESFVGLVYAAGAALSFLSLLSIPRIVHRFSPLTTAWVVIGLEFLTLLSLAFFYTSPFITIPALLLHLTLPPILWYALDLLFKGITENNARTGQLRTLFISFVNGGAILAQIIMGNILQETEAYQLVFFLSALTLIPSVIFLTLSVWNLKHVAKEVTFSIRDTLLCITGSEDTRRIFVVGLFLQIIFAWLSIYAPLYFHEELGLAWSDLSLVFAIMLLPYVFLEPIVGFLEDKFFAEREFMAMGFLIVGVATMGISFITASSITPLLITIMLTTRMGAAFVEAATESYFFKHVEREDENSFGLYRSLAPLAYMIGPIVGTVLLLLVPFTYLFTIFGILMLLGIPFALSLKPIRATKEGYRILERPRSFSRQGAH